MAVKPKNKLYRCQICNKAFSSPGAVAPHRRKAHPEASISRPSRDKTLKGLPTTTTEPQTGGKSPNYCPNCGFRVGKIKV